MERGCGSVFDPPLPHLERQEEREVALLILLEVERVEWRLGVLRRSPHGRAGGILVEQAQLRRLIPSTAQLALLTDLLQQCGDRPRLESQSP